MARVALVLAGADASADNDAGSDTAGVAIESTGAGVGAGAGVDGDLADHPCESVSDALFSQGQRQRRCWAPHDTDTGEDAMSCTMTSALSEPARANAMMLAPTLTLAGQAVADSFCVNATGSAPAPAFVLVGAARDATNSLDSVVSLLSGFRPGVAESHTNSATMLAQTPKVAHTLRAPSTSDVSSGRQRRLRGDANTTPRCLPVAVTDADAGTEPSADDVASRHASTAGQRLQRGVNDCIGVADAETAVDADTSPDPGPMLVALP